MPILYDIVAKVAINHVTASCYVLAFLLFPGSSTSYLTDVS